ncbi:hypothetical protein HDU98_007332 [Podochytrium sp. JEL0797]|nr:hypothetical protein HDU98_007332 [Podochytrium sp. JEL0797]
MLSLSRSKSLKDTRTTTTTDKDPSSPGLFTLSRIPTLGRTTSTRSGRGGGGDPEPEEIVYPLSDSGVPISAPTTITPVPAIDYTMRANAGTLERVAKEEVAPNPVKLHTSKAAQTTTLKWWQAPGVTKETQVGHPSIQFEKILKPLLPTHLGTHFTHYETKKQKAALAAESDDSSFSDSLPRTTNPSALSSRPSFAKSLSLGRNNSTKSQQNQPAADPSGSGGRKKFHQYEEVAIIKTNYAMNAGMKGPQWGDVPKVVAGGEKCGAGTTLTVLHNFTATSSSDVSVSQDDLVRILRVDPGGWVVVKIVKLGTAAGPQQQQQGVVNRGAVHRAAVGSAVGQEGMVPFGVLDVMRTKRGVGQQQQQQQQMGGQQMGVPVMQSGGPQPNGVVRGPRPMRSLSTS